MLGQQNANAAPRTLSRATCARDLRAACAADSDWQRHALLFGLTVANGTQLPQLQQDLAFFLLARGPYAWAGWGVWGMCAAARYAPFHAPMKVLVVSMLCPARAQDVAVQPRAGARRAAAATARRAAARGAHRRLWRAARAVPRDERRRLRAEVEQGGARLPRLRDV